MTKERMGASGIRLKEEELANLPAFFAVLIFFHLKSLHSKQAAEKRFD